MAAPSQAADPECFLGEHVKIDHMLVADNRAPVKGACGFLSGR